MTNDQQNRLVVIGGAVLVGLYLVKRITNPLNPSPAPGINTGLNGAFTENASNKRKYTYTISSSSALDYAESINNALTVVNDDFDTVMGVFNNCSTQGDVFAIALMYKNQYQGDLWTFLSTGAGVTGLDGLSNAHLTQINDYVNSLPL